MLQTLRAECLSSVPENEISLIWQISDKKNGEWSTEGDGKTFTVSREYVGKWIRLAAVYNGRVYETNPVYAYGEDSAAISVPETAKPFAGEKVFRQETYPYSVTINSAKGDNYTVEANFGGKLYTKNVHTEDGEKLVLNFEAEPDNGFSEVSIKVKNSADAVLAEYRDSINFLPPLTNAYLAPFTRKMGLAGAVAVDEKNDIAELNSHRLEFQWAASETTKGKYNIGFEKDIENARQGGTEIIALADYNNKLYNGKKSLTNGIITKENLDGYTNFLKAIQSKYSENSPIAYFEIWNEANADTNFWKGADRIIDYVYLAEVSKRELLRNNPKEKTAAGATASGDYNWVRQLLAEGLYPNMDAISNHPYIWNYLADEKYDSMLSGMTAAITEFGGWKEQIITEVGWPTHTGGITKEQQAIELVKQVILADYYDIQTNQYFRSADDFIWDYYDKTYAENNFGVFYHDYSSLKPSAFSISALNNKTGGAVFAGKLPFDDKNIEAYLYARDKEITCIIWTKGEDTNVSFEGETLFADDIKGNYIGEGSTFKIGEAPIYIRGLSYKHIIRSLSENMKDYIDLYLAKSFSACNGRVGFDEAKALLYSSAELAANLTENITEAEALTALEKHFDINSRLIDMYKRGKLDISDAQMNGLLFVNQWGANLLSVIYMLRASEDEAYAPSGKERAAEAAAYIKDKAGENTLSFSSAILSYAEKYADKAEKLSQKAGTNPQKSGAVKAWDKLACLLAETSIKMTDAEEVGYDNVIVQLPSSQWKLSRGEEKTIYVSLFNYRPNSVLTGTLELISPSGDVISRLSNVSLNAGEGAKLGLPVCIDSIERGKYKLRFIENEKLIAERTANIYI